jgi:hypothetical protein
MSYILEALREVLLTCWIQFPPAGLVLAIVFEAGLQLNEQEAS